MVTFLVHKLTIATVMNPVMGIKISCVEVGTLSTILYMELEGGIIHKLLVKGLKVLVYRPQVPIDGGWSLWTSWSSCQSNCRQQRNRTCDNPTPLFSGAECSGNNTELSPAPCYGDNCCPGIKIHES